MEIKKIIEKWPFTEKISAITMNGYQQLLSKINPGTRDWFNNTACKFWNTIGVGSAPFSIIAVIISVMIIFCILSLSESFRAVFFDGVFVEFSGMIFDLIVFGIFLAIYTNRQEKKAYIQTQEDLIDDYLKWNTDEGKRRIAGALRRIQKRGKHDHYLGGINLSDFSFKSEGIRNLSGSSFQNNCFSINPNRPESFNTILKNVSFSYTCCSDVVFSKGFINPTRFEDCDFVECNLINSSFQDATIKYDIKNIKKEKSDWYEDLTGEGTSDQTYFPPFWNANLEGVSFKSALLKM
ncbi:hypothetical protein [Desulfosediminicola ganghwensis]|uniref:hypothetical protein n=1 Tax=Desulfosediminicola ganghwensis TaxID=2569540 RepID=UPI0010AB7344|nr:hypothetical protein [Desulfosediminicola ganghwensis]